MFHKRRRRNLTKKDIEHLTCFCYWDSNDFLATVFSNFPLSLKRHCVQVGAAARLMALHAPAEAIPAGVTREEYANAVRYGSLYHDIGVYLVYNQRSFYPTAGARFLREQINMQEITPEVQSIILETVRYCCERYDGLGYPEKLMAKEIPLHAEICAIANAMDESMNVRRERHARAIVESKKAIMRNREAAFSPLAIDCYIAAYGEIVYAYKCWQRTPPFWKNGDIKPLYRPIAQEIG